MKFNIKYEYKGKVFNFKCVELLYFKGYIDVVGLNRDDNKLYIISMSPYSPTTYKLRSRSPLKRISTKKIIRYFLYRVKTESVLQIRRGDDLDKLFNKPYATELKKVVDILDKDYCNEI